MSLQTKLISDMKRESSELMHCVKSSSPMKRPRVSSKVDAPVRYLSKPAVQEPPESIVSREIRKLKDQIELQQRVIAQRDKDLVKLQHQLKQLQDHRQRKSIRKQESTNQKPSTSGSISPKKDSRLTRSNCTMAILCKKYENSTKVEEVMELNKLLQAQVANYRLLSAKHDDEWLKMKAASNVQKMKLEDCIKQVEKLTQAHAECVEQKEKSVIELVLTNVICQVVENDTTNIR